MSGGAALRDAWDAAQRTGPGDELRKAWERANGRPSTLVPRAASESTTALPGKRDVNIGGLPDAKEIATVGLGTAAAAVRDIPGVEPVQAGVRSLVRRQSYREALGDIRGAEESAGPLATAARIGGATLAQSVLPGSGVLRGALFGAAHGATKADPDLTVGDRAIGAAGEGIVGAAIPAAIEGIPKVANAAGTLGGLINGVRKAKTTGAQVLQHADDAAAAANAAPETADVPDIMPTTRDGAKSALARLLGQKVTEGKADLQAARDAVPPTNWDLMSKMERGLLDAKGGGPGRSASELKAGFEAQTAAPPPPRTGVQDAAELGMKVAPRILSGGRVPVGLKATESPEALARRLDDMPAAEREAFLQALFGEAKEIPNLTLRRSALAPQVLTGFGALNKAAALRRLVPYVRQVEGTQFSEVPRAVSSGVLSSLLSRSDKP